MGDSGMDGFVGHDASARAVASVTDAVRVATEASLAPALKSTTRRDVKAGVTSAAARVLLSSPPAAKPPAVAALASPDFTREAAAVAEGAGVGASLTVPEPPDAPTDETAAVETEPVAAATVRPVPNPPTMETIMTTAEELMSFQQGNFEAMMKSGQIWATGLQDLGRHWAASAQAQMDETMGTVKAMTAVKSLREAVELQSTLARSSVEKVVTEGSKITDVTMKLAEQTLAPITARLSLAAERFGRPTV